MGNAAKKLLTVQGKLNAPKSKYNSFSKFYYRSCEDILTAVKPLLEEVKASIKLTDHIEMVGDRIYVCAQAIFFDTETDGDLIMAEAYAREPDEKKGMDAAQITGTASSYARKYALNGLLLIDDVKDPDTDEYQTETKTKAEKTSTKKKEDVDASVLDNFVNDAQIKTLEMLLNRADIKAEKFCSIYKLALISELPADKYNDAVHKLELAIQSKEKGGQ